MPHLWRPMTTSPSSICIRCSVNWQNRPPSPLLANKHGVAVTVETILLADCLFIGGFRKFSAGERGDKKQQRRLRQVKVRDQAIDNPELVRRINKDSCFALP